MGRTCTTEETRFGYEVSFRKPEDRRPMVRPSYTYEDYIKVGFKEMEYVVMEWIQTVQDLWQDLLTLIVLMWRIG